MRKVIVTTIGIIGIVAALMFIQVNDGKCAFCPDIRCYATANCGPACVCLKKGLNLSGECVSLE